MVTDIYDLNAPELDVYARLTETALRNRKNILEGLFIAESGTAVTLALDAGYEPISLLMERRKLSGEGKTIASRIKDDIPIYTADDSILEALTGYRLSRGILCAMRRRKNPDVHDVLKDAKRIAVLEDIVDSTNVGAIFRSAAALGIDAVICSYGCCDPLCRRSIRVSMGTVFQVPWTTFGTSFTDWHDNGIDFFHSIDFKTAAMALCEPSISIADTRLLKEEKLALLFGTEGTGLDHNTIKKSDYVVRIPMQSGVDSLNVAAASAVAFWQLRGVNYQ